MKKLPFIFLLPLLSTVSVAEQLNYKSFRPHIPTPYEVGYEMEQGRRTVARIAGTGGCLSDIEQDVEGNVYVPEN